MSNKEKELQRHRIWYQNNKERVKKSRDLYYQHHKESISKRRKERYIKKDVYSRAALEARFLAKVEQTDTCWNWLGTKLPQGYGMLTVKKVQWRAHRYAYQFFVGEIPAGLLVLHRCDNPACVNPAHLFLGTHKENMQDCIAKGRFGRWKHKVTVPKGG